jgi:hypothetical protein
MGGLNTRAYLESALYAGDVNQALIMGTPHAGVTLWKTFLLHEIAHWTDEPSARELLPEHVALFNKTHGHPDGVPYALFAGAADSEALPALFDYLPPCDGLISSWSAHALEGPDVRYVTTGDLHAWSQETMLMGVPSYLWPSDTYRQWMRPILRAEPRPEGAYAQPRWAPLRAEARTPLLSGEVAPGESVTRTLLIDQPGTHRVYARWQRGDLDVTLIDPDGRRYEPELGESGDAAYLQLGFAEFSSHLITTTVTGEWSCLIESPESQVEPTGYALYAVLDTGLRLEAEMDRTWYRQGEPTTLQARLLDGESLVSGADVIAQVCGPDHVCDEVALYDDGGHGDFEPDDGIYGGSWMAGEPGGYYPVFVEAKGIRDGLPFARGADAVAVVSRGSARLTGRVDDRTEDADGDGLAEALILSVGVDAKAAGRYALAAKLVTVLGQPIDSTVVPVAAAAGEQIIELSFLGERIRAAQAGGPYLVRDLLLMDENGAAVPLDDAPAAITRAYRWTEFEERPR